MKLSVFRADDFRVALYIYIYIYICLRGRLPPQIIVLFGEVKLYMSNIRAFTSLFGAKRSSKFNI